MKEGSNCKDEVRVDHRNNLWYLYRLLAEQEKNGVQQGECDKIKQSIRKMSECYAVNDNDNINI